MRIDTDKYMLIKFKDQGRDFSGCDCRGLVGLILMMEFGMTIPDAAVSCEEKSKVNSAIRSNMDGWIKSKSPGWPCVLLMCTEIIGQIDHMGLYVGNGDFIHISKKVIYPRINSIDDPLWKRMREGFYVPSDR